MKKNIFGLLLLISLFFSGFVTAFAEDETPGIPENIHENGPVFAEGHEPDNTPNFTIPPSGELSAYCGANGNVVLHVYVADENKDMITRLVFLDKNTGDEYFFKFNPVNYEDENLWSQFINIPQGDYFVSCRVSGDTFGNIACSLYPEGRLLIGPMQENAVCLVGPLDWIDKTYAEMEKADNDAKLTQAANATPTPEPTATPTPIPLEDIFLSMKEEIPEEPRKGNFVGLYIGVGVVVLAMIVLFAKKKK